MKKNKFKKILKKLNKFRLYKGYTSIATIVLSNSAEIAALAKSSEDPQYYLVPKYQDLEFDILPYERPEDHLYRKRKAIKKKIGKTNFKILLGYWTLGIAFFETEEYRVLALKKKEKKKKKKMHNKVPPYVIAAIIFAAGMLSNLKTPVSAQGLPEAEAYIGTFMPHGLDGRSYVDNQIAVLRSTLQLCYENQLSQAPDTIGLMLMHIYIAPNGEVIDVEVVLNHTGNGDLASCVEDGLEEASLDPSNREGVSITLPVTFRMRYVNSALTNHDQGIIN